MNLKINKITKSIMETYGQSEPIEVCGIVTGKIVENTWMGIEFHPITNITIREKEIDYVMNPDELGKVLINTKMFNPNCKDDFVAIFHTHPFGEAYPSSTDIRIAEYAVPYIIYSPNQKEFRAFLIEQDEDGNKRVKEIEVDLE